MTVRGIILPEIPATEKGQERGDIVDVGFDGLGLELAAVDTMPRGQVHSIHCQLELPAFGWDIAFEEEIIVPLHITGELKVVEPAGTNRPKTVGRTQGTGAGPENSLE